MTKELADAVSDGIYLSSRTELPIFRLVFRKHKSIFAKAIPELKYNDMPLINYVHANSKEEANLYGFGMAETIGYVFCYDETELIKVEDIK